MLGLMLAASLAQAQPGQKVLRADLVRSPRGSNLVLRFAKPVTRASVPIVPAGRRLILHLPGPAVRALNGEDQGLGIIDRVRINGRRITLSLNRLARPFADRAAVRVRGNTWTLRMADPTVGRDLADVLLGTPKASSEPEQPFNAIEASNQLAEAAAKKKEVIEEEPAKELAAAAAAVAAAPAAAPAEAAADPAAAAAEPPPAGPAPAGDLGSTLRIVGGVGLVLIGLLGFTAYRRRKSPMEEAFGLRVVSRAKLDHKSSVAALEVGGSVLIVGLSDNGPRLLARLDDGETMADDGDDEAERLRALVGVNPADRLGAWVQTASSGRTMEENRRSSEPVMRRNRRQNLDLQESQGFGGDEADDLRKRLAEIRRACSG